MLLFTKVAIVIANKPNPIARVVVVRYPIDRNPDVPSGIAIVKPPYEKPTQSKQKLSYLLLKQPGLPLFQKSLSNNLIPFH